MLQPVDVAVAFDAAQRQRRLGKWSPRDVHGDLGLAWSSLNLSLKRLDQLNIVRKGRIHRSALAALLPALRYLMPTETAPAQRVRGIPTGVSAPVFEGRILSTTPLVWESENGEIEGIPIKPLHPGIPNAASVDSERHALFACLDAVRGGRAREYGMAMDRIRELIGLPAPVSP